MTLPEAIPIANSRGDYTQSWGRWQVMSEDGKLNCRATPNSAVVHTFSNRQGQKRHQSRGACWGADSRERYG